MADFTSWAALETQIKNDLSNRDLTVGEYRAPDGRMLRYRTADELRDILGLVSSFSTTESAATGAASRRAYVRAHGGSWT